MPGAPTTASTERILQRVRTLCLALPETHEVSAWGHPVFKAGARTTAKAFVAIEPIKGRPSVAFRLAPVDIDLLLQRPSFFATPYGRGLWVSVWVDSPLDSTLLVRLVDSSYRQVALKRMLAALDAGAPASHARGAPKAAVRRRAGK
jgi:predicted DNA-binding protein (MmcQ/YjbR family)